MSSRKLCDLHHQLCHLGSFVTYIISYAISAIGTFLLVLSTWMYTLSPPACCTDHFSNVTDIVMSHENCSAIATSITLKGIGIHVPPPLCIALAMIGLAVSLLRHSCCVRILHHELLIFAGRCLPLAVANCGSRVYL